MISATPAPQRIFLGWDRPALQSAAGFLADGHEVNGTLDLSGVRIALPGSRAGRRLLELLLDRAEERNLELLPPEVMTVGALPERLYHAERPIPHPEVLEAAWRTALAGADPDRISHLLPRSPAAEDVEGWSPLAALAAELHVRVGAEGHTFREVAEHCRSGLLFNDEDRWRVLAAVQADVRERLLAEGLQDREAARLRALEIGIPKPDRRIILLGVVDLPSVVRRVLAAHPLQVTVLIHAPEELGDRFDAWGGVDPEAWEEVALSLPEENLEVVTRPQDQAAMVREHLRSLGGSRSAEEITLGVPDPAVVPYLKRELERSGVPHRYAGGRPLGHTAPYRLLEGVAAFLDGREFEAFASLLRHPDLLRALGLSDPLPAAADDYHALHLSAVAQEPLPSGRESGERSTLPENAGYRIGSPGPTLRQALRSLEGLLQGSGMDEGRGKVRRSLSAWADPLRRLFLALYPDRLLTRGSPGDADLLAMAEALERALEGFEAIPPSLDREQLPAHRALRLLLARLQGGSVPPAAEEGAVELLGWLELHLDDAPVLVVTGVNEPFLPESITADPFLPHALVSRLGLGDNRRRRARDLYLLQAILASRPETLLLAGRRDPQGNPLRLSRLLLTEEPERVAHRLLRLLEESGPPGSNAASPPETPPPPETPEPPSPTFTLPPEPEIQAPAPPDRISVTAFRRLLTDPYRYALERVLELDRMTDEARELDPMGFGNLAHAVVESWARMPGADRMEEGELASALERHLEALARRRFGDRPLPAVRIQVEQLRARLRRLAAVQAERNREGWRIRAVEAAPAGEGVPFSVDGAPILLRGRIDRVDHHPGMDRWQLLDLKTSQKASSPEEAHRAGRKGQRRWVDLQLPLYRHLSRGLRDGEGPLIPSGAPIETGYILLPGSEEEVAVVLSRWTEEELAGADEAAAEAVRLLRRNRFTWDPEATTLSSDDALGAVVGRGVLQPEEGGQEEGGVEDD